MADSMTLPAIVEKIREQRPGVDIAGLHCDRDGSWYVRGNVNIVGVQMIPEWVAIAVLEAALWRKVLEMFSHGKLYSLFVDTTPRAQFQTDTLVVVRALCNAIGVRLEDGNG